MALAALETYVEDRIAEAADAIAGLDAAGGLAGFYKASLENDLKYFHTPSADRIRVLFEKYLAFDVTAGWTWNHYDPARAKAELNRIAKKRGDTAHRSWCPKANEPTAHAITRDELRKHIRSFAISRLPRIYVWQRCCSSLANTTPARKVRVPIRLITGTGPMLTSAGDCS